MISVLIPVYNQDVYELVSTLSIQLGFVNIPAEILVIDDGSEEQYRYLNQRLSSVAYVQYAELAENTGRIAVRNSLAQKARYKWLLFLDGDSKLVSDDFILTYLNYFQTGPHVVVGGRVYSEHVPAVCDYILHWKYGTQRESIHAGGKHHVNRFMTNNFCIRTDVFHKFDFGGDLTGYGYEDTWMGMQLEERKIELLYINNPVLHAGLETAAIFIRKSEAALKNLQRLTAIYPPGVLSAHVKLYHYYRVFQRRRMLWIVKLANFFFKKMISRNLHSCKPSLFLFDLYRLHFFSRLNRKD